MGSVHSVSQWHGRSHVTNATTPPPDIEPYPNRLHSLAGLVDGVLQQHGSSHGTNTTRHQTLPQSWDHHHKTSNLAMVMRPTPTPGIKSYPDRLHSSVGLVDDVLQQHGQVMGPPPQDIKPCHGHVTNTTNRHQTVPQQTPQLNGPG